MFAAYCGYLRVRQSFQNIYATDDDDDDDNMSDTKLEDTNWFRFISLGFTIIMQVYLVAS